MTPLKLADHNRLLRQDLGSAPNGDNLYRWVRAGELTYLSWDGATYDYESGPSGLQVAQKRFVLKKMKPQLNDDQWVLVKWIENSNNDTSFQFGNSMYAFTNVFLDPGFFPWTMYRGHSFTEEVIQSIREDRRKTFADWQNESADRMARSEQQHRSRTRDQIGNDMTALFNVPGSHGHHVEFGGIDAPGSENNNEGANHDNHTNTQNNPVCIPD